MVTITAEAEFQAERVLVTRYRDTIPLIGNRTQQVYDVVNCPGMRMLRSGCHIGDHFEQEGVVYEIDNGKVFDRASDAILAWDTAQDELAFLYLIGNALRRYRFGSATKPVWDECPPAQKQRWAGNARIFIGILNRVGLTIKRLESNL